MKLPSSLESTGGTPSAWRVVAHREISTRIRDKTLLISTAVLVVALLATILIMSALDGRERDLTVAVTDPVGRSAATAGAEVAADIDESVVVKVDTVADRAAAERAVRDGDADVALLRAGNGYQLVGDDGIDDVLAQALSGAVGRELLTRNAQAQGVDLAALQRGTELSQRLLDPGADDQNLRDIASFVFVLLFYVTALTFGMTIAQSVTQEKESRIVEILAAAVPIRALLWGKIVGNTVLAIGQVVLLVVTGLVGLVATGRGEVLDVIGGAMIWYVIFFVLGFAALACLWAVAGSLASRQQDLQSTTLPGQVLLFAPYILAVTAGEGVRTVVSMLPIVSTMLMPARMAQDPVPVWQIGVAVLTTVVAAVVLVRVGARAYERSVLRTGGRISYRDALRGITSG